VHGRPAHFFPRCGGVRSAQGGRAARPRWGTVGASRRRHGWLRIPRCHRGVLLLVRLVRAGLRPPL